MDLELAGRTAIVTGASRGLGRAIAEALAREGANVLGVARDSAALSALARGSEAKIEVVTCDMTDIEQVARLPDEAMRAFGGLDIVVNGVGGLRRGPFLEGGTDTLSWHIDINVKSAATLTAAVAPQYMKQGTGKVINIVSTAAVQGVAGLVSYCTAKGALLQFTRALAVEWAPFGIQVNAIGPGAYATEMQPPELQIPGMAYDERVAKIPDGRMGAPREVGPIACFLASPLSNHVTGALYMTDGGESARL
jgi:2-dehydro-3-deoxy-D-gluconate 5-dehydrogenase